MFSRFICHCLLLQTWMFPAVFTTCMPATVNASHASAIGLRRSSIEKKFGPRIYYRCGVAPPQTATGKVVAYSSMAWHTHYTLYSREWLISGACCTVAWNVNVYVTTSCEAWRLSSIKDVVAPAQVTRHMVVTVTATWTAIIFVNWL